ncbi:unnamed protein product [Allacma fusca]|uniref:Beta-galactosidase n=1 Tax=Allacma fusca TaxID=39272 RepID=A0A8J2KLR1_9HEXA|nr:unnamed protein product [Allacma fusca]
MEFGRKGLFFMGAILFLQASLAHSNPVIVNRTFGIDYDGNRFLKDGEPFRYISGSVHYFRVVEQYWDSILRKMYLGGLNAIQTYVDWSSHQPNSKEEYDFSGNLNLTKFLQTAQKNNLLVILRVGPFMDAERDMGGLPAWLLWQKADIRLRTSDLEYVYYVSRWFDELLPRIKPFLYQNGGPVIMVQVENEYGSYACDKNYTTFLRDLIRLRLGDEVVLFTTDGSGDGYLKCGTIPDVYPSVDFGTASYQSVESYFGIQRHFAPKGPLINSEFYPGWLDHWQSPHSTVSSSSVESTLNYMLMLGANVNIYMFYGGTSFGFSAGSNADSKSFTPCPTSYDYDAPLNEAGDPTEKYFAIKRTIANYQNVPVEDPTITNKSALGKVHLRKVSSVIDPNYEFINFLSGSKRVQSALPLSFEELKVSSGFILYETQIDFMVTDPALLEALDLKDRAYVYLDWTLVGILSRSENAKAIPIFTQKGANLQILVENQGRPCYGSSIGESKGLGSKVTLGGNQLHNWTMWKVGDGRNLQLSKFATTLANQNSSSDSKNLLKGRTGVYVGEIVITNATKLDTFVRFDGWTKGFVFINNFNLGRYWPVVGPQETLYLPAPLLKEGANIITVVELESAPADCPSDGTYSKNCFISLTDKHVINAPTPLKTALSQWDKKHGKPAIMEDQVIFEVPTPPVTNYVRANLTLKATYGEEYKGGNRRRHG